MPLAPLAPVRYSRPAVKRHAILLLLATACGPSASETPVDEPTLVDLIRAEDWVRTPTAADPYAALRPPDAHCGLGSLVVTGELLDINTDQCAFLTLSQPLLDDVERDDEITYGLWHLPLRATSATAAAEATAIIRFGDTVVAEHTVPIPSPERVLSNTTASPAEFAAGTTVYFHLRNHGSNEWKLGHIRKQVRPAR